jgi:hypothetical protein
MRVLLCVALATLVASPGALVGADKEKDKEIESKVTSKKTAASVDFGALGLDLQSLSSLGARIDAARASCDPVILTDLARELSAAEEVAGKTAELTGKELMHQATEMARYRNRPEELKVVARLCGDDKVAADLNTQADKAADAIKTRAKDAGSVKTRGIGGDLYVVNNTRFYLDIYVNYRKVGTVDPHGAGRCHVGDLPFETTHLMADAPGTPYACTKDVSGNVSDYTWIISD